MQFLKMCFVKIKHLMKLLSTTLKVVIYRMVICIKFFINIVIYIFKNIIIKFIIKWGIIIFFLFCFNFFFGSSVFNLCDIYDLLLTYFYNNVCISQGLIYDETTPSYEIVSSKEIYKSWEDDGIIKFVEDEDFDERIEMCRAHYKKRKLFLDDKFYMVLIPYLFVFGLFGLWFFLAFIETGNFTLEDPVILAKTLEVQLRRQEGGWETFLRLFPEYLLAKERKDRTEVLIGLAEYYFEKLDKVRDDLLSDEVELFRLLRKVIMFWDLEVDRVIEITEDVLEEQAIADAEHYANLQEKLAEGLGKVVEVSE